MASFAETKSTPAFYAAKLISLVSPGNFWLRMLTGNGVYISDSWGISNSGDSVVVTFLSGQKLDSQGRGHLNCNLIMPIVVEIPHDTICSVAARYYVPLARGNSLTFV